MIFSSPSPISFFFCNFSTFNLYINPLICTVINGAIATIAITPKASCKTFPPIPLHNPIAKGTKNVEAIVPDATPPESNATAVNTSAPINDKINAIP